MVCGITLPDGGIRAGGSSELTGAVLREVWIGAWISFRSTEPYGGISAMPRIFVGGPDGVVGLTPQVSAHTMDLSRFPSHLT